MKNGVWKKNISSTINNLLNALKTWEWNTAEMHPVATGDLVSAWQEEISSRNIERNVWIFPNLMQLLKGKEIVVKKTLNYNPAKLSYFKSLSFWLLHYLKN